MTDELKPVHCGCGGEAKIDKHTYYRALPTYGVRCHSCGQETRQFYMTEAEAVEAWNKAMGATDTNVGDKFDKDTNVLCKERTAKVVTEDNISICDNCSWVVYTGMKYCPSCGTRLEWE